MTRECAYESRVTPGRTTSSKGGVTSSMARKCQYLGSDCFYNTKRKMMISDLQPSAFLRATNKFIVPTSVKACSGPSNQRFWL